MNTMNIKRNEFKKSFAVFGEIICSSLCSKETYLFIFITIKCMDIQKSTDISLYDI